MTGLSSDAVSQTIGRIYDCAVDCRIVGTDDVRSARPDEGTCSWRGICTFLIVAVIIAWKSDRVLSFWFTSSSIFAGGLAGLFLLAFLSPRANKPGATIGIIASLFFTTYATLTSGKDRILDLGAYNFPWAGVMIGVIAHVVLLMVGYGASLAFARGATATREMTLWGWLDRRRA